MNNLDFAGNKRVIERLGALLDSGRFPHALIIEGEQGSGKRTLAHLLAAALVCRSDNSPCMSCPQCRKAKEGFHPDIYEHSAEGGANSFHVDTVREIIRDVYICPNEALYKIYILGNADCMNASAQNALLKVLEEPPQYAVFILTAQSKSMLLETVLSRSVTVSLEGVEPSEGAEYIRSHFADFTDLARIKSELEVFNGNIGKALEALTDDKSESVLQISRSICLALTADSEYELLKACSVFQKNRQLAAAVAEALKAVFRDALVYKPGCRLISGQQDMAVLLKKSFTSEKIIDLINICDTLKKMALMNLNNSLLITKICYSLREASGR